MISYGDPVYVGDEKIKFRLEYHDLLRDQGVHLQVLGEVEGSYVPLVRFYCFDHEPHYFYGPDESGDRLFIDKTTAGDPLEWVLSRIRSQLPRLVERSGRQSLADEIAVDAMQATFAELEDAARKMAREQRSTVVHERGDVIIEAGPVRFGVEDREPGIAIHVMGDVDGQERELLAFDCFAVDPHYHYGPRHLNQRLYLDTAAEPDSLRWTLGLFKGGKLGPMLEHAGYHGHAARLNPAVLAERVAEVEKVAMGMRAARSG